MSTVYIYTNTVDKRQVTNPRMELIDGWLNRYIGDLEEDDENDEHTKTNTAYNHNP